MYYDRFDIVSAWYLALQHCHGGQWSDEYRRLCRVLTYYRPSASLEHEAKMVRGLSDNAREIYDSACKALLGT